MFQKELQKLKEKYLKRKKMAGMLDQGATWEDLMRVQFQGIKIDSYAPLSEFFLKLYGEYFDYSMAVGACKSEQQELWEPLISKQVQGMISPPMLKDFCVSYANTLEVIRMSL